MKQQLAAHPHTCTPLTVHRLSGTVYITLCSHVAANLMLVYSFSVALYFKRFTLHFHVFWTFPLSLLSLHIFKEHGMTFTSSLNI